MKCLYYLAPSLSTATHQISDDLHAAGVKDFFLTSSPKTSPGSRQHIHSSNYLETLDIIRDGFIGGALGFGSGWSAPPC